MVLDRKHQPASRRAFNLKRILCVSLILSFYITFSPKSALASESLTFIAIGDSVPEGYGLSKPEEENYAAILAKVLADEGYTINYHNAGYTGLTSAGLLKGLTLLTPEDLALLGDADIISLNIGGNDLLGLLQKFILETGINVNDPQLADLFKLVFFEFSPEQMEQLLLALETFANTYENILSFLAENAPNAVIIVDTVYNPLPSEGLGVSEDAAVLIESLNDIIKKTAEDFEMPVIDVCAAFAEAGEAGDRVINFSLYAAPFSVDIHPNAAGHKVMAELIYGILQEMSF